MDPQVESSCERVARAIGRIPSGCFIVTASAGGRRNGMLASWVQQAAFEPLMVSLALKAGRPLEELIDASGAFVVNVLGEHPKAMFRHFGRGFGPDEDAFAGLAVRDVPGGVVIEQQIAWFAASVRAKHRAGDHWIYLAEVTCGTCDDPQLPYVHVRRSGAGY